MTAQEHADRAESILEEVERQAGKIGRKLGATQHAQLAHAQVHATLALYLAQPPRP